MERPPEQSADANAAPDTAHDARVEALQQLARRGDTHLPDQTPHAASTAGTEREHLDAARSAQRRISRRALTIGSLGVIVIILVAVVATLMAHALQPTAAPVAHQKPAPHALQIAPLADGLNCPVDIAWSPDGTHIALLGYQDHCPSSATGSGVSYTSGLLLIFDTKTGTLAQRASLDTLVTGGGLTLDTQTQYLAYRALMWSPDGTRLALPFFTQSGAILPASPITRERGVDPATEPRPTMAGVLLLDAKTLQRTALLTAPFTASASVDGAPEWNLITRQMIHSALQLPPAVGYHWGAGGALLPDDAVSATQAPTPVAPTPVGNPAGGASFSIWQAGETAAGSASVNGAFSFVPGLDLFYARFGAWSPDGAYLLAPTYYGGRIDTFQPPQPSAAQVAQAGWAAALLPARDAALVSLYGAPARLDIAWSPGGQTLAAWNASPSSGAPQLGLYNAASGHVQSSLPVPAAASGQLDASLNVNDMLRWSPDGKRLALMSASLSSLVIWQA